MFRYFFRRLLKSSFQGFFVEIRSVIETDDFTYCYVLEVLLIYVQ
jgi:hypothetical protein